MTEEPKVKHIITVDRCSVGKRGMFCSYADATVFWREDRPWTMDEMCEILGPFWMVLSPESQEFPANALEEYTYYHPLGEYKQMYGILRKDRE